MRRLLGCLLAGALTLQLGATTTGRAVDQLNSSSMRGVPVPPLPTAARPDRVWIPDRYVYTPEHPHGLHVPGHWLTVTREGQVIAPPRVGTAPGTGAAETLPAAP
jgi:hypothetical protein